MLFIIILLIYKWYGRLNLRLNFSVDIGRILSITLSVLASISISVVSIIFTTVLSTVFHVVSIYSISRITRSIYLSYTDGPDDRSFL